MMVSLWISSYRFLLVHLILVLQAWLTQSPSKCIFSVLSHVSGEWRYHQHTKRLSRLNMWIWHYHEKGYGISIMYLNVLNDRDGRDLSGWVYTVKNGWAEMWRDKVTITAALFSCARLSLISKVGVRVRKPITKPYLTPVKHAFWRVIVQNTHKVYCVYWSCPTKHTKNTGNSPSMMCMMCF